jgi:hypothetical protein
MNVLLTVVLPVFFVVGIAALAQTRLRLDIHTLSRAVFYLFSPALVFDSLSTSDVSSAEFGQITAVLLLTTLVLWGLGIIIARLLRLPAPTQAAFLSAILLVNAGNFGLPVNLFAFGEPGLARAAIYFAVNAVLSASLGVYLAARGRAPASLALRRTAGVPLIYAAALGLGLNLTGWALPEPLQKAIHLLGQASVPVMLGVLGVRLVGIVQSRQPLQHLPVIATVTVLRLLVAPAIAWGIALLLGLQGLTRDVAILQSAMPTAVITTIVATEFDSDPPCAALCVLVTTLVSLPTLTVLLNWLV